MITRRSFALGLGLSLAGCFGPGTAVFWFYSTKQAGIDHCPSGSPVSFDLPCHGEDHRKEEPDELAGWRARLEAGENLFGKLFEECSVELDRRKIGRAVCGGVSRGGFAALHLSLHDPRFYAVAALSPVTDLKDLSEFAGYRADTLSLRPHAAELAKRRLFLSIETHDNRVSTASSIALAEAIRGNPNSDLTYFIQSGRDHTVTPEMMELTKRWIVSEQI